jgi:hypothetical protein
MPCKKKKEEKGYICKIKISAKKKRSIEICARAKGITLNRFIKDAINQSLIEAKAQMTDNNGVLKNQLELFDTEDFFKTEIQLNLDL